MKKTTLLTIVLAPIILIIIKYIGIDSKSLSYFYLRLFPTFISFVFFVFFLYAYLNQKNMVLYFTKKFYNKKLTQKEIKYLSHSDIYWVFVILVNIIIQILMAFYASETIWVFYSSVGWYFYMFIALVIHIGYGKLFALRDGI